MAAGLKESITVKLNDDSTKECKLENLHDNAIDCPQGFIGKGDDEFCLSVKMNAVENEEAARQCYEDASDLLQVHSSDEDEYVVNLLASDQRYALPIHPGFYHTALYQRQAGRQYYHRNGARVKYQRDKHNKILIRSTDSTCVAYAPLEALRHEYKFFWKDISCDTKAPFVCRHNPDFLGFHKLSDLELDVTLDVKIPSMSMTTCLALCQATTEPTQIVFVLENRCICSKGSPQFKTPVYKIKNRYTDKFLTALDLDQPVQQMDDASDNTQHWKWNGHGLESLSVAGASVEFSRESQSIALKTNDPAKDEQRLKFRNGQLVNPNLKKYLGVNGNAVLGLTSNPDSMWMLIQVETEPGSSFARIPPSNKPFHGAWPFDCQKLIPCNDVPHQTCGCDLTSDYEDTEKRGIVQYLGSGSGLLTKLDFQSCEELQFHTLEISGYFMIGGAKTYCSSWSKSIIGSYESNNITFNVYFIRC